MALSKLVNVYKLTPEQFYALTDEEKRDYANQFEIISPDSASISELVAAKTTGEQGVGSSEVPPTNSGVCSTDSSPTTNPVSEVKDTVPSTVPQPLSTPLTVAQFQYIDGFDIKDPVELLFLIDEDIASGRILLAPWQIQHMVDYASTLHNEEFPFNSQVRAPNGSGKDMYVIASEAVWSAMVFKECTIPITSASGFQLDNQTCKHIRRYCEAVNRKFGCEIFKINYRHYVCIPTRSEMHCYATDEPKKAEGFHPLSSGRKMCMFASEAKTIPDSILNEAMTKCTGYTHRVQVSTPGPMSGFFFEVKHIAIPRRTVKDIKQVNPIDWIEYHITYKDCPHIKPNTVNMAKRDLPGGEHGAAFQSQFMAEFGSYGEQICIPYEYIWPAFNDKSRLWEPEPYNKAGLDLSGGGDEQVLFIRNGNKMLGMECFNIENADDLYNHLLNLFDRWDLNHPQALIFGDAIGIGKPTLDRLRRKGYSNVRYFDSRQTSPDPRVYLNMNSWLWFHNKRLYERKRIILQHDHRLVKQLSSRYYKYAQSGVYQMLDKKEQKKKTGGSAGVQGNSPDRADASVMSFRDYETDYIDDDKKAENDVPFKQEDVDKWISSLSLQEWSRRGTNREHIPITVHTDFSVSELESEIAEYNNKIRMKIIQGN